MAQKPCRSPLLLAAADSVLLVIDVQQRFVSLLPNERTLLWNVQRLAEGASVLGVPCLATEQYPEKLGHTVAELLPYLSPSPVSSLSPSLFPSPSPSPSPRSGEGDVNFPSPRSGEGLGEGDDHFPSPRSGEGLGEGPQTGQGIPGKLTFSCAGCEPFWESLQQLGRRQVVLAGLETHVCVQQTALDLLSEGFDVFLTVDAVGTRWPVDHRIAVRRMAAAGITLTTTESVLMEWCERAGTPEFKQISQIIRRPAPERKEA